MFTRSTILRERQSESNNQSMAGRLAVFLALLLALQLGPACGFAGALTISGRGCCQTKCPSDSSKQQSSCCRVSVTSDKAAAHVNVVSQAEFSHLVVVGNVPEVQTVGAIDWAARRSPAPPPFSFIDILCSRQI